MKEALTKRPRAMTARVDNMVCWRLRIRVFTAKEEKTQETAQIYLLQRGFK